MSHRRLAAIAGAVDPIPMATAQFFGISLVAGVTGGAAVYALSSAPAVTTLGLSGGAATSEVSVASLAAQLKFTATVAARQALASRRVPLQTIAQAILSGQRMADPQNHLEPSRSSRKFL